MTKKNSHSRYREKNRVLLRVKQAMRRAGPAAPPWLSEEDNEEILAVYREAQQWTEETGVVHEVDHMVPLNATSRGQHYLCGLHVPWNLRAIPQSMNQKRGDWFFTGTPPIDVHDDGDDDIPW
ncbi:hypothetical protein [Ruegeria sp. AD91A]|uniref:hypothetical protein n=1 Tax=Ruegeria sp. AD91A TaxID=2293862 RepID=UPI0013C2F0EE|nr:hypothetical protein [Ruegeria sp. AD91A]